MNDSTTIDLGRVSEVAVDAARAAGDLLRERITSIREVRHKGVVDIVTDVDVQSEQLVRETILRAFPTHSILGEEGGCVDGTEPRYRWIVDPLDGTTNYAHGFLFFCVSIAFERDGEIEVGAIYDPTLDELYVAQRGAGATLNGTPLQPSRVDALQESLLATGFPYDRARVPRALRGFATLTERSQAVRRAGSAALDLCYVAAGRFDGYWEYQLNPWDMAAGVLLVQEAGGTVSLVDGTLFRLQANEVVASNSHIHAELISALTLADGELVTERGPRRE